MLQVVTSAIVFWAADLTRLERYYTARRIRLQTESRNHTFWHRLKGLHTDCKTSPLLDFPLNNSSSSASAYLNETNDRFCKPSVCFGPAA